MMHRTRSTLLLLLPLTLLPASASAAGTVYAEQLTYILGLPVTNSILTSWVVSALIIFLIRSAVKVPQLRPTRGQTFIEMIVTGISDTIEPIVGKHMVKPTFWLLSGLFFFIVINNWIGLLPGVGTIGWVADGANHITRPLIRPGNADLNMTLALALVSMAAWFYFVFKYAGAKVLFQDLFGNKANKNDLPTPLYLFLGAIFLCVGLIEIISIAFRPVSLSFRLFGNVFGGENLLVSMQDIMSYLLPVPFYFLETLVGVIQAGVFMLLIAVYIGLICNHDSEDHDH